MENETETYEVYIELEVDGNRRGQVVNVVGHIIDGEWVQLVGTETVSFYRSDNVTLVRVPNLAPDEDESV